MEKQNRCAVQFMCWGSKETCEFYNDDCKLCYCTNKQAQIDMLIQEGFEIKEGEQ